MAEFCPSCGTQRTGSLRFCRSCGYDFDTEGPPETVTSSGVEPPPSGPPTVGASTAQVRRFIAPALLVIAVVVIFILAVQLGGLLGQQQGQLDAIDRSIQEQIEPSP